MNRAQARVRTAFVVVLCACNQTPGDAVSAGSTGTSDRQVSAPAGDLRDADPYADAWRALGEPSLSDARTPDSITVLRFIWSPSFDPAVVVRVVERPAHCSVIAAVIGQPTTDWGAPNATGVSVHVVTHPGKVLRRDSTSVPVSTCIALKNQFELPEYWSGSPKFPAASVDGSLREFERLDAAGYRVFLASSPDSVGTPALWRAGTGMLRAAHALPTKGRVY